MPKEMKNMNCVNAGSGEVLLFKRKDFNRNFQKNEICLQQCLSELKTWVRIARGILRKERNSSAVQ